MFNFFNRKSPNDGASASKTSLVPITHPNSPQGPNLQLVLYPFREQSNVTRVSESHKEAILANFNSMKDNFNGVIKRGYFASTTAFEGALLHNYASGKAAAIYAVSSFVSAPTSLTGKVLLSAINNFAYLQYTNPAAALGLFVAIKFAMNPSQTKELVESSVGCALSATKLMFACANLVSCEAYLSLNSAMEEISYYINALNLLISTNQAEFLQTQSIGGPNSYAISLEPGSDEEDDDVDQMLQSDINEFYIIPNEPSEITPTTGDLGDNLDHLQID